MKRLLALVSCLSFLLTAGCQEEPYLSVSPTSLSFDQGGGSQTVQVSANYAWTASVSGSGFTVSPKSGEGAGSVTVTASAATSPDEVSGSVTFQSEGLTASVALKQDAKSVIQAGSVAKIPAEGGTITVDIQYNTEFSVEVESAAQSWITFAGTKSLSSGKLTFEVKENDGTDPRTGKVTVKDKSGKASPVTLTFEQEEKKVIEVGDVMTIPAEGGTYQVDVKYNTDFTVEVEEDAQSWITFVKTKALKSGKLEFRFKANGNYEERTGRATVKDKAGKVADITLTFQQEAKQWVDVAAVSLDPESAEIETGETLALKATVEPEDASDKTVTWSSGKPEVATVDENGVVTGVAEGTATITAKAGEKTATCEVTVKLSAYAIERAALVAFYQALDGDHWKNNTNWCSDKPVGQWYGVRTDSKGRVTRLEFSFNGLKGIIPECIGNLEKLTYLHLGVNYNITGPIPESIGKLVNLKTLALFENKLTGTIPESIMNLTQLEHFSIYQNQLDGILSEKLYYSDWWVTRYFRMDQQEGYGLKFENIYESSDFSRDGEVRQLQRHTKGPGFKIVITADGFSDRMIADGKFDMMVNRAVEAFFVEEPYKSFRDYFDVYSVVAVSKNELIAYDLAFETTFSVCGPSDGIRSNYEKINEYIRKVPDLKGDLRNVTALVLVNKNNGCVGPFTFMYDDDYALCLVGAGDGDFVKHEAAGHGFGKLADEYYYNTPYTGNLHEDYHQRGWYLNVDDTNDPAKVLWKDFLADPYYQAEGIGIYQGALYNNWYKSTSDSIMLGGANGFNAPSRWAIYQRIKKLAGEECSFEEFLKYDKSRSRNLMASHPAHRDMGRSKKSPIICNYPSSETGMR